MNKPFDVEEGASLETCSSVLQSHPKRELTNDFSVPTKAFDIILNSDLRRVFFFFVFVRLSSLRHSTAFGSVDVVRYKFRCI